MAFASSHRLLLLALVGGLIFGSADPASAAENPNAPAISGELFDLGLGSAGLVLKNTTVQLTTRNGKPALQVAYSKDAAYPAIQFPCPHGGWNLSTFGGVRAEVTNTGAEPVRIGVRVDNNGDWKTEPFNVSIQTIAPGETKAVEAKFGRTNNSPGYALDTQHVIGVSVLAYQPKAPVTVTLSELRACGSPEANDATSRFSTPADRAKAVTPPEWIGQRPPVDGAWVETFNERFDGKALNEKVWGDRLSWSGTLPDWGHRFTPQNILFEDGVLKIKCEKRAGNSYDDPAQPHREYTTALITTFNKWRQCYGYFEARMKLPTARGLWPAFWMMPDRAEGPKDKRETTFDNGMEFDVIEHLTEWGAGRYNIAAHWDGYAKEHQMWSSSQTYFGPTVDGWHNFGMLWEPGKLTWYCDGIKKGEWVSPRVGSVPANLIIDVHMGGWATKGVDLAHLPDYLQVEYVKAWQLKERVRP